MSVQVGSEKYVGTTREAWLTDGVRALWHRFPVLERRNVRVSVGFPKGARKGAHSIGQCWDALASADNHYEIFVCPSQVKPVDILAILLHELIHASVGIAAKHGRAFKAVMREVGLEGKPTATVPGDSLLTDLASIAGGLGPYPHGALTPGTGTRKVQGTRMHKFTCPGCGWAGRSTEKHLSAGLPTCHCGVRMALENGEDSDNPA